MAEVIGLGRKEAESLKSVIESGEILKLDRESRKEKLKEYEKRIKQDMESLPSDARETYYGVLHEYLNNVFHDTIVEDNVVSGVCGRLLGHLTSTYRELSEPTNC